MSEFTLRLVKDDTGKLCMQGLLEQFSATLKIPEELLTATAEELREFVDLIAPEMKSNLLRMKTEDMQQIKRRAKRIK